MMKMAYLGVMRNLEANPYQVDRVVAVINEQSNNVGRIMKQLGRVKLPIEEVITRPGDIQYTWNALDDVVRKGDCIVSVSGDTGTNITSEYVEERQHKDVVFLPSRGGGACDNAVALNGRRNIDYVLRYGRVAAIRSVKEHIKSDENERTRHIFGYITYGSSAPAALKVDSVRSKNPLLKNTIQPLREFKACFDAMENYPRFLVEYEDGREFNLTNLAFVHSRVMSRHGITGTTHFRPEYEEVRLTAATKTDIAATMVRFARGRLDGVLHGENEVTEFTLLAPPNRLIESQRDGEYSKLARKVKVAIRLSQLAVPVLTTSPDAVT